MFVHQWRRVAMTTTGGAMCLVMAAMAVAAQPAVRGPAAGVRVSRVVPPPKLLSADQVVADAEVATYSGSARQIVQVDPPVLPPLPGPSSPADEQPAAPQLPPGVERPLVEGAPQSEQEFLPSDEETTDPELQNYATPPTTPTYLRTMLGREPAYNVYNFRPYFGPKMPNAPLKPHHFCGMPRSWPCSPCESYANPCLGIAPPQPVGIIPVLPFCPYCPPKY